MTDFSAVKLFSHFVGLLAAYRSWQPSFPQKMFHVEHSCQSPKDSCRSFWSHFSRQLRKAQRRLETSDVPRGTFACRRLQSSLTGGSPVTPTQKARSDQNLKNVPRGTFLLQSSRATDRGCRAVDPVFMSHLDGELRLLSAMAAVSCLTISISYHLLLL